MNFVQYEKNFVILQNEDNIFRSVYYQNKGDSERAVLDLFAKALLSSPKESTFDILYDMPSFSWTSTGDIIDPVDRLWICDLRKDELTCVFQSWGAGGRISLEKLRRPQGYTTRKIRHGKFLAWVPGRKRQHSWAHGHISTERKLELENCTVPCLFDEVDEEVQAAFAAPVWELQQNMASVPKSYVWLMSNLLEDLNHSWGHILRGRYGDHTFRKLASAVVRIATLDFRVVRHSEPRHFKEYSLRGIPVVSNTETPRWKPSEDYVVDMGDVVIILSQDPALARELVQRDFDNRGGGRDGATCQTYLLLSVRHILLCKASRGSISFTQPTRFLTGERTSLPVSVYAILYYAFGPLFSAATTRIHRLPVELREMVVPSAAEGDGVIQSCLTACALGVDMPSKRVEPPSELLFSRVTQRSLRESFLPFHWSSGMWLDEEIWFGFFFSGLVYRQLVPRQDEPRRTYVPAWHSYDDARPSRVTSTPLYTWPADA